MFSSCGSNIATFNLTEVGTSSSKPSVLPIIRDWSVWKQRLQVVLVSLFSFLKDSKKIQQKSSELMKLSLISKLSSEQVAFVTQSDPKQDKQL